MTMFISQPKERPTPITRSPLEKHNTKGARDFPKTLEPQGDTGEISYLPTKKANPRLWSLAAAQLRAPWVAFSSSGKLGPKWVTAEASL